MEKEGEKNVTEHIDEMRSREGKKGREKRRKKRGKTKLK